MTGTGIEDGTTRLSKHTSTTQRQIGGYRGIDVSERRCIGTLMRDKGKRRYGDSGSWPVGYNSIGGLAEVADRRRSIGTNTGRAGSRVPGPVSGNGGLFREKGTIPILVAKPAGRRINVPPSGNVTSLGPPGKYSSYRTIYNNFAGYTSRPGSRAKSASNDVALERISEDVVRKIPKGPRDLRRAKEGADRESTRTPVPRYAIARGVEKAQEPVSSEDERSSKRRR
ncbi:hypothetical protein KM043_004946 [Ampulex compressa]|nr:hypothetical protein KM043_004946 [Ampulex compressa]